MNAENSPLSTGYAVLSKRSYFKQLWTLMKREYLIKKRDLTTTSSTFVNPIYMLVILYFVVKSTGNIDSIINLPFVQLSSKIPQSDIYALAYTNSTNIDGLIPHLNSVIASSEPKATLTSFKNRTDLIESRKRNPGGFVIGVEFMNITIPSTKSGVTGFNDMYMIFMNTTDSTIINSIHTTAKLYIETALLNYHRAASGLNLFKSPLQQTDKNGISAITVKGDEVSNVQFLVPYFFVLMYLSLMQLTSISLLNDKEKHLKSGLIMMGCNPTVYMSSYIASHSLLALVFAAFITPIAYFTGIYRFTSPILLALVNILFGMSSVALGALLSIPFSTVKQITLPQIVYIFFCIILFQIIKLLSLKNVLTFASVLNIIPYMNCLDAMLTAEFSNGVDFSNWRDTPVFQSFCMLAFDCIFYTVLALRLNLYRPGENNGIPIPLAFPKSSRTNLIVPPVVASANPNVEEFDLSTLNETNRSVLSIRDLCKNYPINKNEFKVVVDSISFHMHGNQIFALLGHNGAGKTTTLSCIIGMIQSDMGQVFIKSTSNGIVDIMNNSNRELYLEDIGVCPQFDFLIDSLTVREHFDMYVGIKGVSMVDDSQTLSDYIADLARDVGLYESLDSRSASLSGGMKRKLSVDEPTTGIDIAAQSRIWKLIKEYKKNRLVLLTTHSMEEAEVLGDRIAIMSKGKIQTLGTSLFLKKRFGTGYLLKIERSSTTEDQTIVSFIQQYFPSCVIESQNDYQLIIQLNKSPIKLAFTSLYRGLEESMTKGDLKNIIKTFSLNSTTLEQVFLKLKDDESIPQFRY
ncbi:hypothetical protein HDV02_000900 [Globomyces sp. JEL0801]|nr:hypothetical protein HDV02_000900 [Globomyces sp. JEL0801]